MKGKRNGSNIGKKSNGIKLGYASGMNIDLSLSPRSDGLFLGGLDAINKAPVRSSNKRHTRRTGNSAIQTPKYSVSKTRQMNWKQLKKKFPSLDPNSDADFDGLVNSRDCKPFDPSKDGAFSRFLGVVTGGKKGQTKEEYRTERAAKSSAKFEKRLEKDVVRGRAQEKKRETRELLKLYKEKRKGRFIKPIKKTIETIEEAKPSRIVRRVAKYAGARVRERILTKRKDIVAAKVRREKGIVKAVERFAGVKTPGKKAGKAAKGQAQAGAGRPKQSYKYKDPRTGQPISAVEYHRLRKQLKKQAKTVETQTEIKQRFALAKRGLSPEEVEAAQEEINAKMARLRAIKEAKQEAVQGDIEQEGGVEEVYPVEAEEQAVQQQVQQIPTQVIQRQYPTAMPRPGQMVAPPGYRIRDDLMTGKKTLVAEPQQEAWSR